MTPETKTSLYEAFEWLRNEALTRDDETAKHACHALFRWRHLEDERRAREKAQAESASTARWERNRWRFTAHLLAHALRHREDQRKALEYFDHEEKAHNEYKPQ